MAGRLSKPAKVKEPTDAKDEDEDEDEDKDEDKDKNAGRQAQVRAADAGGRQPQ